MKTATQPAKAGNEVVVTRIFDAPPAIVWKAWAEPQHFMRWYGPRGFTSPGGTWEARVVYGTRSPIAIEAGYVGSLQSVDTLGLDENAGLLASSAEAAIRVQAPLLGSLVRPYLFAGGGVTRYAKDVELAQEFLEWLATEGQDTLVADNHEYPANPAVAPEPLIAEQFGNDFKRDTLAADVLGSFNADAVRLMDEADFG